jgi:hypothetical protein
MTAERRGTLQLIGVACFILFVLFAIFSIPLFWGQIRVLRSWPVRQAEVISSQVVIRPAGKHDQLYTALIRIVYVVDGHPVTAELSSYQSNDYASTLRRADEFPAGSQHAVRYDPAHPADARLGAGWNRRFFAVPLITLACGLSFAAIAAGLFIGARIASA